MGSPILIEGVLFMHFYHVYGKHCVIGNTAQSTFSKFESRI